MNDLDLVKLMNQLICSCGDININISPKNLPNFENDKGSKEFMVGNVLRLLIGEDYSFVNPTAFEKEKIKRIGYTRLGFVYESDNTFIGENFEKGKIVMIESTHEHFPMAPPKLAYEFFEQYYDPNNKFSHMLFCILSAKFPRKFNKTANLEITMEEPILGFFKLDEETYQFIFKTIEIIKNERAIYNV